MYTLYACSFILVFIQETCTWIFRLCFWIFNLALLSIFVFCFVEQLQSPDRHHSISINHVASVLLLYTFSFLYKNLNKIDASLAKLLFKSPSDPRAQKEKILDKEELNLKDVLRYQDYVLQTANKPNAVYRKSNWITFLVFLCPIFILELAVYYTLMMNQINNKTWITDTIYFVSLILLVFILNSIKAENLNKVFLPSLFFMVVLFGFEVYYLVLDCIGDSTDPDSIYTQSYRKKFKLVLIVLSIKTCVCFVFIGFGKKKIRNSYKQTKLNFNRKSSVSSKASIRVQNLNDSLEEPLIKDIKEIKKPGSL